MPDPKDKFCFKVECPKCWKFFWIQKQDPDNKDGLVIGWCDLTEKVSSVRIVCPKCGYDQDFW